MDATLAHGSFTPTDSYHVFFLRYVCLLFSLSFFFSSYTRNRFAGNRLFPHLPFPSPFHIRDSLYTPFHQTEPSPFFFFLRVCVCLLPCGCGFLISAQEKAERSWLALKLISFYHHFDLLDSHCVRCKTTVLKKFFPSVPFCSPLVCSSFFSPPSRFCCFVSCGEA